VPFGGGRVVLMDARGGGLRLTWHPADGLTVLSLWREDRCVGTFRATPDDMARIISFLSGSLAAAARGGAGLSASA